MNQYPYEVYIYEQADTDEDRWIINVYEQGLYDEEN